MTLGSLGLMLVKWINNSLILMNFYLLNCEFKKPVAAFWRTSFVLMLDPFRSLPLLTLSSLHACIAHCWTFSENRFRCFVVEFAESQPVQKMPNICRARDRSTFVATDWNVWHCSWRSWKPRRIMQVDCFSMSIPLPKTVKYSFPVVYLLRFLG